MMVDHNSIRADHPHIRDPAKRHFLENLTTKILHVEMDDGETKRIDLQKLLTPANDSEELLHAKNKKMYASSYFYAPSHPTVEDQVELARRISYSLSDVKNLKSKGQSMYVNRKKRSVKWIHDGNGIESDEELESGAPTHKDKIPLKCMMNPNGKVLDIHGIQALGEEVNIEEKPSHPEKLFDIVRDLNNQKGRGAEIFAKRRKRSEKWVVEKEQSQTTTLPPSGIPWKAPLDPVQTNNEQGLDVKENSALPPLDALPLLPPLSYASKTTTNNTCRPFYNPFTLDLSLDPGTPATPGNGNGYAQFSRGVSNYNGSSGTAKRKTVHARAENIIDPDFVNFLPFTERDEKMSSAMHAVRTDNRSTKKSRTHGGVKRKSIERHTANDSRVCSNRNQSYKVADRSVNGRNAYNGKMVHTSDPKRKHREQDNDRNYGNAETDSEDDNDDEDDNIEYNQCGDGVDHEYTPIPVKQLIKEFEKTCRPMMQYKRIDPSKIPPQLYALDNDVMSRYFEGRTYGSSIKHEEDMERVNDWESNQMRIPPVGERSVTYDCEEEPTPDSRFPVSCGIQRGNNDCEDPRRRDWRLKYIDEEETSTSDDSTETSESLSRSPTFPEENDTHPQLYREFPDSDSQVNTANHVQIQNGTVKNTDVTPQIDSNDKSLILAMVASEEDILQTIKQLRRTPVLNNLIPSDGSPDPSRFSDLYPEVGNKLYENTEYQGPKLSSYQKLSNYNTAPRGWDQAHTYYRPITFGRPQEAIVYSDF